MDKKLTTQEFWDSSYKDLRFSGMSEEYPTIKIIYENFLKNENKTIFEIGCFPGRFLYHFGKLGYELNGIDQTEYLDRMIDWFKNNSFKIGGFRQGDVFNLSFDKQYDVVASFGFIEHFENFEEVLKIHCNLVKAGGYIYVTVPNFAGFIQNKLHSFFDNESLNKHCVPSMDPEKWARVLKTEGFEIIKNGYLGGFDFWVGNQKRNFLKKIIIKAIRIFLPIRFLPNSRSYSPEIYIIAKKI